MATIDWVKIGFACALVAAVGCDSSDMTTLPSGTPDGACTNPPGATDRFVDCGNGTVTDTQTNLVWLKDARCLTPGAKWVVAVQEVGLHLSDGSCGLTDHSKPGDWRVPGLNDWAGVLPRAPDTCEPALPDKTGTACFSANPWADGIAPGFYWTGTAGVGISSAWAVNLIRGFQFPAPTGQHFLVWAVRDGS